MSGDEKLVVLIIGVITLCLTVLYSFLFLALWQYKEWVGISLLGVVFLCIGVFLRGKMIEQSLRLARYKYREEIPFDRTGEPMYWPTDAQENPHRLSEGK